MISFYLIIKIEEKIIMPNITGHRIIRINELTDQKSYTVSDRTTLPMTRMATMFIQLAFG